ncbi:hypothetical protein ACFYVL_32685 [Streptomyces sp. NPDC004111]|uniref:hypothetical protein n=1 Tax=Streptomyces sp. NPDC004111 TaxID=3364690 RepID=UPI003697B5F2
MPDSSGRAEAIAARLSALGLTPRTEGHARHTSIEVEVPDSISAESWREALEAVAEADRFGLLAHSLNGRMLWAAVLTGPAAGDAGELDARDRS